MSFVDRFRLWLVGLPVVVRFRRRTIAGWWRRWSCLTALFSRSIRAALCTRNVNRTIRTTCSRRRCSGEQKPFLSFFRKFKSRCNFKPLCTQFKWIVRRWITVDCTLLGFYVFDRLLCCNKLRSSLNIFPVNIAQCCARSRSGRNFRLIHLRSAITTRTAKT